ncbi:MAG: hypothetical protein ACYDBW_10380 [Sulfuricaulis sp.]
MPIAPGGALYYFILILIGGNLFALIIGLLMLASPRWLGDFFKMSNRWVSTRRMTKPLETPLPTDRALLRYPRVLGAIMLASAALILIKGAIFISEVSVADGGRMLARLYSGSTLPSVAWETIWLCLIIVIMVGALLAVVVGMLSLFRHGQLDRWVGSANRWVSTRQITKPLDMPHYPLDNAVSAHPRLWGGVIAVLALVSALVLWWFLRGV